MASQDAWAKPLAVQLVDKFRCSTLNYVTITPGVYDPDTGKIALTETVIPAAGAVGKSMKQERTGVEEEQELEVWLDHQKVPWPINTDDRLEYLGKRWKITDISPTYSGDVVYASKVTARAE